MASPEENLRPPRTDGDEPIPTGMSAPELLPLVYAQLHAAARRLMTGERASHTLQPTALVGEAYARLAHTLRGQWSGTREFYFAAARAMQQILIEHARRRGCVKRGGDVARISLDAVDLESEDDCSQVLTLDDAIARLDKEDRRAAEVVRLRFYAGLTVEQTAAVMDQSRRTVQRDWEFARAWLLEDLRGSAD